MRYDDYLTMTQQGVWAGGWVDLPSGTTVYITADHTIEQSNDNGSLGSFYNPFSETAYNEMMAAHIWPGGHVQHGDGVSYHQSYAVEMDMSGSFSAWVAGDEPLYVQSGQEVITSKHDDKVNIILSWNAGYVGHGQVPPSYLSIYHNISSPYVLVSNSLQAQWGNGYNVTITGELKYKLNGSNTIETLSKSSYEIPDNYCGNPDS